MNSETHVIDDLPAYALGMLENDEERRVSEHISHCSQCAAELEAYLAVTGQLALGAPDVAPSPRLKQAILDRVQKTPDGAVTLRPTVPAPAAIGWRERLAQFFQRATPVWGMASLVLVIALVTSNLLLLRQIQRQTAWVNHFQVVSMLGTNAAPQASGVLVISPDGKYGTLVVNGLSDLEGGKQYQLWMTKDQQRVSGGLLTIGYSGYGALKVESQTALDQFTRFGITIEPPGGSQKPTGARVLGSGS